MLLQAQTILLWRLQPKLSNCPVCLTWSQMTVSPRRWEGRRWFCFLWRTEAQLWPRDGWRLVGWLVEGFFPLQQALHFVPGLRELAAGAQRCQGGADTGGQVWAAGHPGTRTGVALLPRALEVPSWREAVGVEMKPPSSPPHCFHPLLLCERLDSRFASARCFQKHSGEVEGNGAHETSLPSVGPWCPAGEYSGTAAVRAFFSPSLPAFPRTCPALQGFCLRCWWGRAAWCLGVAGSPAELCRCSGMSPLGLVPPAAGGKGSSRQHCKKAA